MQLQPDLYPRFFLTRTLSGIEKKCLLLRGAKEKVPDVADADLVPLDHQKQFASNSSLGSFWKALSRKPEKVPKDEFYFLRMEGPAEEQACTGLVLLQHISNPTTEKPFMEFDMKGFCSTGKGKGTLLLFKLTSYLRSVHPSSRLLMRLSRFSEGTINFCMQMGFEKMAEVDALSADLSSDTLREMAQSRVGGVVEVLKETEAIAVQTDDGLLESFLPPPPPPSAEVAMFGEAASYFGLRYAVRGNGTCWLYAILAALGVLEHANEMPLQGSQAELKPTNNDLSLSELFIEKMRAEVRLMRNMTATDLEDLDSKKVATSSRNGTYGGGTTDYAVLAYLLQCTIVKLDQSTPRESQVFMGNRKGSYKKYSAADLSTLMRGAASNGEPVLVVEFNGLHGEGGKGGQGGHFAGYQSPEEYMPEKPSWLQKALGKRRVR